MDPDSTDRGAGDLWELTIDDLFSTADAAASDLGAAVPGPFTIDLCDSVEPASGIAPCLRDFDQLQVYQVTDWKDDRLVFRLRLGPIDSELEADAILSIVRRDYPAATTLPMGDDDLRMISIANGSSTARAPAVHAIAAAPVAKAESAQRAEAVGRADNVEQAARNATPRPEPAVTAAKPAPDEPEIDPAATVPSTMADARPADFATAFRDLAAELLALDPTPARPDARAAKAAGGASPPVLTAAIPTRHAPTAVTGRAPVDPQARAPVSAPPVLRIDAVARPSRERGDVLAAVVPAPGAAKVGPRSVDSAAQPQPQASHSTNPATMPPPAATRPLPPPATSAATTSSASNIAVASVAPAAAAPNAAAAAPVAPTPAAKATAPRREPAPIAPTADDPPPSLFPPVRNPRAPDAPRVALRGATAATVPVATPASVPAVPSPSPAADAASTAALTLAAERPAVVAPVAGDARISAPSREVDLELELLPDDLAAPAIKPAAATAAVEAFAASTVTLELVVDAPRLPPTDLPEAPPPASVAPAPPPSPSPVSRKPTPAATPTAKAPSPTSAATTGTAPLKATAATPRPPAAAPGAAPKPTTATPPSTRPPTAAPTRTAAPAAKPSRPAPAASTTAAAPRTPASPVKAPPVAAAKPGAVSAPASPAPKKPVAAPAPAAAMPPKPAGTAPPVAAATRKAPASVAPRPAERPAAPEIDSTRTLRALVVPKDPAAPTEKLIVIQLVLSEQEIAPESVPDLAIFKEYRLYSAVGEHQGKVMHALRLGFFSDEGPAEMVAGYLRSYFDAPVVTRISLEERERFATRRISARKEGTDTGVHTAIELASAPRAPSISLADLSARVQAEPTTKPGQGRSRG